MRKPSFWLLSGFLAFIVGVHSLKAEAGTRVGNGGAGWLCRNNSDNEPRWLELVDLFEARMEFALEIPDVKMEDEWDVLDSKIELIKSNFPKLADKLTVDSSYLRMALRILPGSAALSKISDGHVRIRPASNTCLEGNLTYTQLANFTNDDRLLVDGGLWRSPVFSVRDKGALLTHELIYKSLRDQDGDLTSSRARTIVGYLFSGLPIETKVVLVDYVLEMKPDGEAFPEIED